MNKSELKNKIEEIDKQEPTEVNQKLKEALQYKLNKIYSKIDKSS